MSKPNKYDQDGNRLQTYKKGHYEVMTAADPIADLINLGIKSLGGRKPTYAPTQEGLQCFREKTLEYFEHLKALNAAREEGEAMLMPDVESWCVYIGITRQTLHTYSRTRDEDWKDFIARTKDLIMSVKKDMAARFKMPPMFFIFDAVNNFGYVNTNQVQLVTDQKAEESAKLEDDVAAAGLKWDAERGEYVVEDTSHVDG